MERKRLLEEELKREEEERRRERMERKKERELKMKKEEEDNKKRVDERRDRLRRERERRRALLNLDEGSSGDDSVGSSPNISRDSTPIRSSNSQARDKMEIKMTSRNYDLVSDTHTSIETITKDTIEIMDGNVTRRKRSESKEKVIRSPQSITTCSTTTKTLEENNVDGTTVSYEQVQETRKRSYSKENNHITLTEITNSTTSVVETTSLLENEVDEPEIIDSTSTLEAKDITTSFSASPKETVETPNRPEITLPSAVSKHMLQESKSSGRNSPLRSPFVTKGRNTFFSNQLNNQLLDPCKDRLIYWADRPESRILTKKDLFVIPNRKHRDQKLPDNELLLNHFLHEGRLSKECATEIIKKSTSILKREPNVLSLAAPFFVVGDIHGQFYDLTNIFKESGEPSKKRRYLFLGDFVDRGMFSCEVMLYLLSLKISRKRYIYLLRGNHETRDMSSYHNFQLEVKKKYGEDMIDLFMKAFDALPLAATITAESQGTFFCCHGGLSQIGRAHV